MDVARSRLAAAHGVLGARWLRSLQLRVITTTLIISAVVVTVVGFFLMQQIASDQLKAKETQAGNLVGSGQISAETEPGLSKSPNGGDTQELMSSIVRKLQPPGNAGTGSDYRVTIMLSPRYPAPPPYALRRTHAIL